MQRLVICASGFVVLLSAACHRGRPRDASVLLMTLDTTRADHLGCYAGRTGGAKTPHLDALAGRGVRFSRAFAQVPLTLPSHASIMTGMYPPRHGLRDMEGFVLDKSHPTIASIAQGNGFATAAFVGARVLARTFGLDNGFSSYDDDTGAAPERRAAEVTDRALAWLKENGKQKFFLWVHYFDPHVPYDAPEPYKHLYARDPYAGEIAYMDEQVGRLLNGIQQEGTLVIVIGDHGESLGEHGELTHGVFLYDSTLHVPFIVSGPGVPQAKVIPEQVRSIDVMPTILSALNLQPGGEVQGVSLWPLIDHGSKVASDYSYGETIYPRTYMGWSELRGMRTDSWSFVVAPHPELYNLQRDPGEKENLIAGFPADAERLQRKVWEVAGENGRQEKLTSKPMEAKTLRELKSLGYLGAGTRQIQLGTPAPDPKDRVEILKIFDRVEDLLQKKDYRQVAQLAEQGLRLDPTNPRCHLYLATAYEETGQYQRAVDVFQHALSVNVETDKIFSRLGIDYLHLQRFDKAVGAMVHASRLNPADLNNLLNLGMAYMQLGRIDDAAGAFRAIVAQDDRYAAAHDGLGLVAAARKDMETARREFEKAVEVNPDEAKALLDLGILYQNMGNREQALHYLQLFLSKAPKGQFAEQLPAVREAIQELKQ
jgi:arylsulfatase A-like enzyme/Flp pilus assembly protein TadD